MGHVELRLHVGDCPHLVAMRDHLRDAMSQVSRAGKEIIEVLVETVEEGQKLGFVGSPACWSTAATLCPW